MTSLLSADTTQVMGLFIEILLKSTLLIAAAAIATFALRGATASLRHLLWSFTLVALLAIPGLMLVLPRWQLGVLPHGFSGLSAAVGNPAETPGAEPDEFVSSSPGIESPTASLGTLPTPLPPLDRPLPPMTSSRSLIDSLALLWIGGLIAGLIAIGGGLLALRRIERRAVRLEGDDWNTLLTELANGLGITREVRLLASPSAAMPSTWGMVNPVVLLPADAIQWDDDRRRVVLLHELAHVKRNDCLTQLVAQLCCAVYWFHPGAWYTARRVRAERELACDEHVLGVGVNACDYAAHLLDIARVYRAPAGSAIAAIAMARPSQLEGRLLAILDARVGSGWRVSRRVRRATILGLTGLTLPLAAMQPWRAAPSDVDDFRWKGSVPAGEWVEVIVLDGDIRAELSNSSEVEILAVRKSGDAGSFKVAVDTAGAGARFCVVARSVSSAKPCETKVSGTLRNGVADVRVDFLIKVPAGVGVSAHAGRGNIAAEGVQSYVWGTSVKGDISITTTDLAEASTRSGSISAEFGRRRWKQNLEFLTDSGDVTVVAPTDARMMFEAVSESGRVRSEFPAQVRAFGAGQRAASTANGGGGMLTLHSGRGLAEIKRGGKAVADVSDIPVESGEAPRSYVDPKPNPNPNPDYDPDPNINPHVQDDPTGERVQVTIPGDQVERLTDAAIRGWADAAAIARLRNIAAAHIKLHGSDLVKERAQWALTLIRNGEIVAPLKAKLSDDDWRVRAYAAWALGETRDERGSGPLTSALGDSHWRVRMHAAGGLQRLGTTQSLEPLIAALSDEHWQVRITAIDALAAIGDRRALAPLQLVAERDQREMIREEALNAIRRIK
jgi:beta-lactamase regulating signal transducer with metallopeptidase domain